MRYSASHRTWWQSVFFNFKIIKRHFHLCISSPNRVATPHGRSVTSVAEAQNSHTSMPGSHFSKVFLRTGKFPGMKHTSALEVRQEISELEEY